MRRRASICVILAALLTGAAFPGVANARIEKFTRAEATGVIERILDRRTDSVGHRNDRVVRCTRKSRLRFDCLVKWDFGNYQGDYCLTRWRLVKFNNRQVQPTRFDLGCTPAGPN